MINKKGLYMNTEGVLVEICTSDARRYVQGAPQHPFCLSSMVTSSLAVNVHGPPDSEMQMPYNDNME